MDCVPRCFVFSVWYDEHCQIPGRLACIASRAQCRVSKTTVKRRLVPVYNSTAA